MDRIDFECRFEPPDDSGEIVGTAVAFDVVDDYRTSFDRNAFRGLETRSLPMLWNHDPSQVLGSWTSLQIRSDGLTAKGKLNLDVQRAREVRSMLANGDVSGLSIRFYDAQTVRRSNGVRHIVKAKLREISVVTFPAVPGSTVTSVRSNNPGLSAFVSAVHSASKKLKG